MTLCHRMIAIWEQAGMPRSHQGGCMHIGPGCGREATPTPAAGKTVSKCCPPLMFHCLLSRVGCWLLSEVGFWSSRTVAFILAPWRHSCVYPHQGNCQAMQPHQNSSGKLVAQHSNNPEILFFKCFFHFFKHYCFCVICFNPFSQLGF